MSEPRTEAGRRLLEQLTEDEDYPWRSKINAAILAIEAESMSLDGLDVELLHDQMGRASGYLHRLTSQTANALGPHTPDVLRAVSCVDNAIEYLSDWDVRRLRDEAISEEKA